MIACVHATLHEDILHMHACTPINFLTRRSCMHTNNARTPINRTRRSSLSQAPWTVTLKQWLSSLRRSLRPPGPTFYKLHPISDAVAPYIRSCTLYPMSYIRCTRTYILQAAPYIRCCLLHSTSCTLYPIACTFYKLHPISDAACCCSACGVVSLLFICGILTAGVHDMVWFGME